MDEKTVSKITAEVTEKTQEIQGAFSKLWDNIQEFALTSGIKIILAIIVLLVGFKLTKSFVKFITNKNFFKKADAGVQTFLKSFIKITLKVIVVLTVATILGVPMTSLVALLGSAGVAVALAIQGGLSNLAGGLIILLFKPFVVGDFVTVDSLAGTVKGIDIFYTTLVTIDNKKIVVPNGSLTNKTIVDVNTYETRRVDYDFTVSYKSDIDKVKNILMSVITSNKFSLKNPEPFVRLSKHSDSALVFTCRVWCNTSDYWELYYDLIENVKKEFDKNKIEIPYPQMDIHLDNN